MRTTDIPRAISLKAKELKETLSVDEFMELQRLALETYLDRHDEDKLTQNCERYREFIKNLNE